MRCDYFDDGRCSSCRLMGVAYSDQVRRKQDRAAGLLAPFSRLQWSEPALSPEAAYRNKAKMVVGGTLEFPTIGIVDAEGYGVDLQACGICSDAHRAAFPALAEFIRTARLVPYSVPDRSGELKHLIITESPDGELMVRFVLRSTESVSRISKHLPSLQAALPWLRVVSVNLLPAHKATLEGEQEILLTQASTLPMRMGQVVLHLRPQGFFQTNTVVAQELYRQAARWSSEVAPASLWDLYCGVGGFALHLAGPQTVAVGVETSAEAIEAARRSAAEIGLTRATFLAGDATSFALQSPDTPELVVVNPPRRGIGATLAQWLEQSSVRTVLYSSCNPVTLAADLAMMPSLVPVKARLFDMFPQTDHTEVLILATRT